MSAEVYPFGYKPQPCPKCGGSQEFPSTMTFCHFGGVSSPIPSCWELPPEHLHVRCIRCGFGWITETYDAKKVGRRRDPNPPVQPGIGKP